MLVYAQAISPTINDGIIVFSKIRRNLSATIYREIDGMRARPPTSTMADCYSGNANGESGDIP